MYLEMVDLDIKTDRGKKPGVSLVIPTLNEAKNLPLVLPYIPLDIVDEVILVDGRSTDNTVDVARRLLPSVKIILEKQPGKGTALRRGYSESSGDIIVVMDADGSHDPREIPRFIRALLEGADFVKGSRFAPLGGTTDMPRLRKMGNGAFVRMVNFLFSQKFSDLCYGFHAFWGYCLDYLDLSAVNGFEVDTAIYLQAVRRKLKIVDVPSYEGYRFYGVGKLQTFPDGWRVLRTIMREWQANLHDPLNEPRVGFRGYARRPALPWGMQIPGNETPYRGRILVIDRKGKMSTQRMRLDDMLTLVLNQGSKRDLQTIIPNLLLFILENFGASSGSIVMLNGKTEGIQGYVAYGKNVQVALESNLVDTLQHGSAGWVIQNQQPVIIRSTQSDPRWVKKSWEEGEGLSRSAVVFPVTNGRETLGVLTLTRPEERCFTEEDLEKLKKLVLYV